MEVNHSGFVVRFVEARRSFIKGFRSGIPRHSLRVGIYFLRGVLDSSSVRGGGDGSMISGLANGIHDRVYHSSASIIRGNGITVSDGVRNIDGLQRQIVEGFRIVIGIPSGRVLNP